MLFADKLSFDHPRKTSDGYLVGRARAARAGTYDYLGREIDPEGKTFAADQVVKVYRPESEVFDAQAVASFLMKPVTNNHPSNPVTADNWREHAKGVIGKALRDGEYLAFDIVLMDAATIADVEAGKRELSNGYASEIVFGDGTAPDGSPYQATQRSIRGNHVAVVDKGRAGPMCRIGDAVPVDSIPSAEIDQLIRDERTYNNDANDNTNATARRGSGRETSNPSGGGAPAQDGEVRMPHTLMIDGLQVTEVSDQAKAAIEKLQGQVRDAGTAKSTAEANLADANTTIAARDAEIVTLKQAVEDAKVSPAQLRDQAKAYALVCDKAKALEVKFAEDADADTIMKAVVDAKMGDAAKDYDAKQIAAAFAVLTKDAKPRDPVREAISSGVETIGDAKAEYEKSREKLVAALRDAYKTPANAA